VAKKEVAGYFLVLSFIFAFVVPQMSNMLNDFAGELIADGFEKAAGVVSNMKMDMVMGYAFYFVLGYVLSNTELTGKQKNIIYILGAAGFVSTILLNGAVTWKTNTLCNTYYGNFNVNIVLEAVAVFVWFKSRKFTCDTANNIVSKLSKYCFGAYLIHIISLNFLAKIGLNTMTFLPVLSVPVVALIVMVSSFAISYVLSKCPGLNKWIV